MATRYSIINSCINIQTQLVRLGSEVAGPCATDRSPGLGHPSSSPGSTLIRMRSLTERFSKFPVILRFS